jgi:hypothetical protein
MKNVEAEKSEIPPGLPFYKGGNHFYEAIKFNM